MSSPITPRNNVYTTPTPSPQKAEVGTDPKSVHGTPDQRITRTASDLFRTPESAKTQSSGDSSAQTYPEVSPSRLPLFNHPSDTQGLQNIKSPDPKHVLPILDQKIVAGKRLAFEQYEKQVRKGNNPPQPSIVPKSYREGIKNMQGKPAQSFFRTEEASKDCMEQIRNNPNRYNPTTGTYTTDEGDVVGVHGGSSHNPTVFPLHGPNIVQLRGPHAAHLAGEYYWLKERNMLEPGITTLEEFIASKVPPK